MLDTPDDRPGNEPKFVMEFNPGNGANGAFKITDGSDLCNHSDHRRDYYSFVFQSGYLLDNFTVLDNVIMPLRLKKQATAETKEYARKILRNLGIKDFQFESLPRHLSGGERQRVAVARALAHRPRVLFADEPTASLDPFNADIVMDSLRDWQRNSNGDARNLLVLVTHDIAHAMKHCNWISVFRFGKLVYDEMVFDDERRKKTQLADVRKLLEV
jgi:ABC-type lipoprotein export system ATPase subunit